MEVIGNAETCVNASSIDFPSECNIDGFPLFKKDRVNRRGVGVATYVRVIYSLMTGHQQTLIWNSFACALILKLNISVTDRPPGHSCGVDAETYNA